MDANRKIASFTIVMLLCFLSALALKSKVDIAYNHVRQLLFLLVFSVGTLVNFSELIHCAKNKLIPISLTVLLRLLYVPLIAFISINLLKLSNDFSVGMIYLSIVPSAMIATVFSRMVGGDIRINIVATVTMLVISPLTVPILSWIYLGHVSTLDVWSLFNKLLFNVVIPLMLGIGVNQFLGRYRENLKGIIDVVIIVTVGLIVMGITGHNGSQILTMDTVKLVMVLTLFYVLIFLVAVVITTRKFIASSEGDKRAIRNELSLSDCALSSVLASFYSSAATIPSAMASFWQIICIGLLNFLVHRKSGGK